MQHKAVIAGEAGARGDLSSGRLSDLLSSLQHLVNSKVLMFDHKILIPFFAGL